MKAISSIWSISIGPKLYFFVISAIILCSSHCGVCNGRIIFFSSTQISMASCQWNDIWFPHVSFDEIPICSIYSSRSSPSEKSSAAKTILLMPTSAVSSITTSYFLSWLLGNNCNPHSMNLDGDTRLAKIKCFHSSEHPSNALIESLLSSILIFC